MGFLVGSLVNTMREIQLQEPMRELNAHEIDGVFGGNAQELVYDVFYAIGTGARFGGSNMAIFALGAYAGWNIARAN
ncbi:MAG: hypothetical protein ACFE0P_09050 [Oceanicaulis sp.]